MPTLFLIAGHSLHDPGAVRAPFTEAELTRELRRKLADRLRSAGATVCTDPDAKSLAELIPWVRERATPADGLLSLHFNAATPAATGSEVFVRQHYSGPEMTWAQNLAETTAQCLGRPNRGVKLEGQTRHGRLGILHSGPGTSALLEVAFLTNEADMAAYQRHEQSLAERLSERLLNQFVLV